MRDYHTSSALSYSGLLKPVKGTHVARRCSQDSTRLFYIKERKEGIKAVKYKCIVCGYIYDPEIGDPDGGIKLGTPFEELPDAWVCPICGASKNEFERIE